MFGVGSSELLVILLVAFLVLGPKDMSAMAYKLGRYVGAFRRMSSEFQRNLNLEIAQEQENKKNSTSHEPFAQTEEQNSQQATPGNKAYLDNKAQDSCASEHTQETVPCFTKTAPEETAASEALEPEQRGKA